MKKIISVLLALLMMTSVFSVASFTYAEDNLATVYFNGYEANNETLIAVNILNAERAKNGYVPFVIDEKLTIEARQRAKELFICYGYDLPDGRTPDFENDAYYDKFTSKKPTVDEIYSKIADLAQINNTIKSIGIGVYTVDDISTIYIIISTAVTTGGCRSFENVKSLAAVSTLVSNIDYSVAIRYDDNYFRMNPAVLLDTKYGLLKEFDVTEQYTISSSNSKVCKAKGGSLYPKACGSYAITATNKTTGLIVTQTDSISYIDNVVVKKPTVKSDKEKRISIKWSHSNADASGYEIQYSTSKKFKKGKNTKTVTVKNNKSLSKNIKGLKSNKVYYVRIRGYVDQGNNEKIYGKYSKTVKVRVK